MNYQLYIKRRENKLRQCDVAERLRISSQSYYLKENGKSPITIQEGRTLAKLFDCSLDDLFGEGVS